MFSLKTKLGAVLWSLAVVAISITLQDLFFPSQGRPSVSKEICALLVIFLLLTSAIVFLLSAAKGQRGRSIDCGGAILAIFTLMIWFATGMSINRHLSGLKDVRETTQIIVELHKMGNEIEKIRSQLGRVPKDEEEFVRLRGKPMPTNGQFNIISYYKSDSDHYQLNSSLRSFWGQDWDLFGYVMSYYGPNSTQRIFADLF